MDLLLLASGFSFQYRVLRCAAATGARVHVLGDRRARSLTRSRHLASFTPSRDALAEQPAAVTVAEINRLVGARGIAMVLPTDGATTAFLAAERGRIKAPCFPMPDADTFALLNDKGRFCKLCSELGLPHPRSWVATSKAELRDSYLEGRLPLPCIVKPPALFGKIGVQKLEAGNAAAGIARIDYTPILVQDFVPGEDICISLFCRGGDVLAEVTYTRRRGTFHFTHEPVLYESARAIARHLVYDGVLAFDARRTPDRRRVELIECNPRFWFNMDIAMLAGINFVELGLRTDAPGGRPAVSAPKVRNIPGLIAAFGRPWTLRAVDARTLRYHLSDPAIAGLLATGLSRYLE